MPRLTELTAFALIGFGTFSTHLGNGVYGPELESTLKRQSLSSKPMTWDAGIRAPISNRILKGTSSLPCGCTSAKYSDVERLFYETSFLGAKTTFPITAQLIENMMFAQKNRRRLTCLGNVQSPSRDILSAVYGDGASKPRLKAFRGLANTHEDHPNAAQLILSETYGVGGIVILPMRAWKEYDV